MFALELAKKGGEKSHSFGAESSRNPSAAPGAEWDDTRMCAWLVGSSASKAGSGSQTFKDIDVDMPLKCKKSLSLLL